jgi:hypothetical protein
MKKFHWQYRVGIEKNTKKKNTHKEIGTDGLSFEL